MDTTIIFAAKYLFILPILILIYVWGASNPHDRYLIVIRAAVTAGVAIGLVYLSGHYIPETRPYIAQGVSALITNPPTDNSFPSDHTTISFCAALLVLPFSLPLGAISLVAAALVGTARVFALVHTPIDIIGGIGVAIIASGLAFLFFPGARKDKEKN